MNKFLKTIIKIPLLVVLLVVYLVTYIFSYLENLVAGIFRVENKLKEQALI